MDNSETSYGLSDSKHYNFNVSPLDDEFNQIWVQTDHQCNCDV